MLYRYIIGVFFDIAFNARNKAGCTRLAVDTEYADEAHEKAKWLHENETKRLSTMSFDGYRLEGHFFENPQAKRTVICAHGWRGTWDYDYAAIGYWLAHNECNVLIIEQRGQDESPAPYMSFGIYECRDVDAWTRLLCDMGLDSMPIYLHGISMGSATVMMAAGEACVKEKVAGIIADCGYSDPYDMIYGFGHRVYKIPKHPVMDSFERTCEKRLGSRMKSNSPYRAMSQTSIPMLFVHGLLDDFVPVEMTKKDYEICSAPKKLLLVKGAEHAMSFYVNPKAYTEALKEFFSSTLSEDKLSGSAN